MGKVKRTNLKIFRIKKGLTQQDMADLLNISKSHYVSLELGNYDPSYKVLERFSLEFGEDDVWEIFKKE